MATRTQFNPPVVVACILSLIIFSFLAIIWSLILIVSICDTLVLTGIDLINALVLLSGIIMFPSNVHMFNCIVNNRKVCHNTHVIFCPLWMNLTWCLIINTIGLVMTILKLCCCHETIPQRLTIGMRQYRTSPIQKHFLDNLQWSLKCCGLKSYRDWFNQDWYDKIRDYEWDSSREKRLPPEGQAFKTVDSVPQSCCKTGSCISNYLSELGTFSIHTRGCKDPVYRFLMIYLVLHIVYFIIVIILDAMVFTTVVNYIRCRGPDEFWRKRRIFKLAAHYIGRRRNCYSVAVRNVHRALVYATKARQLKKDDMKALWETRINAACEQHNITFFTLKEGLDRANIMLDRKSLSDLASWEPKTFESLAAVARQKLEYDNFADGADKKYPTGIDLKLKDVMLDVWLKENK